LSFLCQTYSVCVHYACAVARLAPNVVAASRRRGYRNGSDESKWWCYLLCVRRDCTPACVKPLVGCSGFTLTFSVFLFTAIFNFYSFYLSISFSLSWACALAKSKWTALAVFLLCVWLCGVSV